MRYMCVASGFHAKSVPRRAPTRGVSARLRAVGNGEVNVRKGTILQRYMQRCESAHVDNAQVDNTQDEVAVVATLTIQSLTTPAAAAAAAAAALPAGDASNLALASAAARCVALGTGSSRPCTAAPNFSTPEQGRK